MTKTSLKALTSGLVMSLAKPQSAKRAYHNESDEEVCRDERGSGGFGHQSMTEGG